MISKDQFTSAIESMRLQQYEDKKNGQLLAEAFSLNEFPIFQNDKLTNTIINLLSIWFDKEALQEYCFIYEFGKIGLDSEWETPEMLYDKLLKNK